MEQTDYVKAVLSFETMDGKPLAIHTQLVPFMAMLAMLADLAKAPNVEIVSSTPPARVDAN